MINWKSWTTAVSYHFNYKKIDRVDTIKTLNLEDLLEFFVINHSIAQFGSYELQIVASEFIKPSVRKEPFTDSKEIERILLRIKDTIEREKIVVDETKLEKIFRSLSGNTFFV